MAHPLIAVNTRCRIAISPESEMCRLGLVVRVANGPVQCMHGVHDVMVGSAKLPARPIHPLGPH
jgi:hypothetical protein